MTSQLAASNLALPLQIFLVQSEKQNSEANDPGKALVAWATFQQSLEVNLDELRDKVFIYISDEAACQNILESAVVRGSDSSQSRTMATYDAYLARVANIVDHAPDAEVKNQLRALDRSDKVQTMLKQRLQSSTP